MEAVQLEQVAAKLRAAGCVAADDEAEELMKVARGDPPILHQLVERRISGEPLAWITGTQRFCGLEILVDTNLYVPRWQSEQLALRAASLVPEHGIAVDICTGTGAIATVLAHRAPHAQVLGVDIDPAACECARRNGIESYCGRFDDALPQDFAGKLDVVVGVVPYVPTPAIPLLPRDAREHEPLRSLDGGHDGSDLLLRATAWAAGWLRTGGWLLLEMGADQLLQLQEEFARQGFADIDTIHDGDGDPRGLLGRRYR